MVFITSANSGEGYVFSRLTSANSGEGYVFSRFTSANSGEGYVFSRFTSTNVFSRFCMSFVVCRLFVGLSSNNSTSRLWIIMKLTGYVNHNKMKAKFNFE